MKYYVNKDFEKNYDDKYHNYYVNLDNGGWFIHSEDYDEKYSSWRKCGDYMILPPMTIDFLKEVSEDDVSIDKKDDIDLNIIRMCHA